MEDNTINKLQIIHDTQILLIARLNRLERKYDLIAEELEIENWDQYDDVINEQEIQDALNTIAQSINKI
uniref:Uncharacterized protein n=1 Tax=Sphingobacterium sp. (strain 21) TaxID=743722 RepID=F4C456_SPHS2